MKRRIYKTKRLILRPYTTQDFDSWAWAYRNIMPKQNKFDWVPPKKLPIDRREFQKMRARHLKREKEDKAYIWAIYVKNPNLLVGVADISILTRDELQVANLGYRIINRYWRQGFAKEAMQALILKALRDLKLNRLEAVIDLDNRASIALVKSLGLEREGIRRKFYYQHGRWDDQIVYVANHEALGLRRLVL